MPISAQCLFSLNGLPFDVFEIELKEEGWLDRNEILFDVLSDPAKLMRPHLSEFEPISDEPFDDTWTEEDYINYYEDSQRGIIW